MSDSHHRTEPLWKDAAALVERVEMAARSDMPPGTFFDELCAEICATARAWTVSLWTIEDSQRSILARNGLAVHDEKTPTPWEQCPASDEHAPSSRWFSVAGETSLTLVAVQKLHDDILIGLELRFDDAVDLALQKTLSELAEAVLDLAAGVFMRSKIAMLRRRLDVQTQRDEFTRKLYEGIDLEESFASTARAVAEELSIDRVSMFRRRASGWRMIASSTPGRIDRRARQVRWLEILTGELLESADRITCVLSDTEQVDGVSDSLVAYRRESGCKEFHVELIHNDDDTRDDAAIVLERFRDNDPHDPGFGSALEPIRHPVSQAIQHALRRDDAAWGLIAGRLSRATSRRKLVFVAGAITILVLAACLIPVNFDLPVEGRIVAAQRNRIFAPAQGVIADIAVNNGERVRAGDTLVVLRSADLDLQRRQIEGALATAQSRFDSLLVTRSGNRGGGGRDRESGVSADEQVVKTEIEGLEKQLQLLQAQNAELTVASPMDGRVDRWNLHQSLSSRPVAHGQFLLDVVDDRGGWIVDLDLPEKNLNYVLTAQANQTGRCHMRLRSNPTEVFEGDIAEIADVAHLNSAGQSVIRLSVPFVSETPVHIRSGATVAARLHCGKRPIGFVWFRGLIEWSRRQGWF